MSIVCECDDKPFHFLPKKRFKREGEVVVRKDGRHLCTKCIERYEKDEKEKHEEREVLTHYLLTHSYANLYYMMKTRKEYYLNVKKCMGKMNVEHAESKKDY